MATKFKVDDHVTWNSEAGHVSGKIIKVHTRDTDYKGYTHHATPDDPQYGIKSDKTDARRDTQRRGAEKNRRLNDTLTPFARVAEYGNHPTAATGRIRPARSDWIRDCSIGYQLRFKPCVALEPWLIARRGMWQWNVLWSVLPPGLGRLGQ